MLQYVTALCLLMTSQALLLKETVCKSLTVQDGKYACHTAHLKPGTECDLRCNAGYTPSNPHSKLKCLKNGHWSKTPSKCIEIRCPNPSLVHNGAYKCDKNNHNSYYKYNAKCHLTCGLGFKPSKTLTDITCLESGHWSTAPKCIEIVCPQPPKVSNGIITCQHADKHVLGDTCRLHCDTGYRRSSDVADIGCLSSSTWSTVPSCVEIKCPHPPLVANGGYKCSHSHHKLHDVCHLHCNHGYKPHSTPSDIHCTPTDTWSTPSTCDEILCPNAPTVTNGVYDCGRPPHTLGKVCALKCGLGFRSNSTSSVHCLPTNQWSATAACVEIRCPNPPMVPNGQYRCPKVPHRLNQVCHLQCNTGYRRSSTSTDIHCLGTELWSNAGHCEEVTCPEPPTVLRGSLTCPTKHTYDSICKLTCDSGFKPNTPHNGVHCLQSGQWEKPPACKHITCPSPPSVANGSYTCGKSSYHLNTTCTLHCDLGFRPKKAHSNIKCLHSEAWSSQLSCVEVHCPLPPSVDQGHFKCNGTVPHRLLDTCSLMCNHGYKPTHRVTYCTQNGHWWHPPTCEEVQCPNPNVTNGRFNCEKNSLHKQDDICDLQCDNGFKPSNSTTHTRCLANSLWSHSASCSEIHCPKAPTISHGKYVCHNQPPYKLNDVCILSCHTGYHPNSTVHEIHCQASEKWSTITPCVRTVCPKPPSVTNGVYKCVNAAYTFADKCSLQCNSGYRPSSKTSNIQCLGTGKWSTSSICHEITCPAPPIVVHGLYHCHPSQHKLNDSCNLRCDQGYKPSVLPRSIQCLYNESWSNPASCVEIRCPVPPTVVNGRFNCTSGPHKLGDLCELECDHGYKSTSTNTNIQCKSSDTWSKPSTCTAIQCPDPPKLAHGRYHCPSTKHGLDDECTLQCNTGYKSSSHPAQIACLSTNSWSQHLSCLQIRCPVPPAVRNGAYHCTTNGSHQFADICHLACNTGYKPSSEHSDIHCLETDLWSQAATCQEIRCPVASKVSNGVYKCSRVKSFYRLNEYCTLQCNERFMPNSNNTKIHCKENNKWSTSETCREIRCPSLPKVAMGKYQCNSSSHSLNTVCHLQCFIGYRPATANTDITCLSSEKWSTHNTCRKIRCPDPPSVTHGNYSCASNVHGLHDVCHLQCASGFKPSLPYPEVHCQVNDTWSQSATCEEIQCPRPKPIANGKFICSKSSHYKQNDVCQLQCDHGYKRSSDQVAIVCLQSSSWSPSASCIEILCPNPQTVVNGSYDCRNTTNYKLDSVCMLRCDHGYRPQNISTITCLAGEEWSDKGMCVEIQCPVAPKVGHGTYKCPNKHKLNDRCRLQCATGYKPMSPTSDIHCTETDTWSVPDKCIEINCSDPPALDNGNYACTTGAPHRRGDQCDLQCDYGFKPASNSTSAQCLTSGLWSASASCAEVQCSDPASVTNGHYDCGNTTSHGLDDVCTLLCDRGFRPTTSITDIQCLQTEEWSTSGGCVEIRCPEPPSIMKGMYLCQRSRHKLGNVCQLQCDHGYEPSSLDSDIQCSNTEKWTSPSSCVEIQCGPPPILSNGSYDCDNSNHTLDDVCNIQCDYGFKPNTAYSSIHCIGMNHWSTLVACVEIQCPLPAAIQAGNVTCNSTAPFKLSDECSLQCDHGFRPNTASNTMHCLSSGIWSLNPSCVEIHCPAPPKVQNGLYSCGDVFLYKLDAMCSLQCNHGYRPNSIASDIQCLSTDRWSDAAFCEEIHCPEKPTVLNGEYICSNTSAHKHKLDESCHLQCNHGFKPTSTALETRCLSTGQWSVTTDCIDIQCRSPLDLLHGVYDCGNRTKHMLDDNCSLHCDRRYKPSSASTDIHCLSSETWSNSAQCEEVKCHEAPTVLNGEYHCSDESTHSVDELCHLQCHNGYRANSKPSEIYCMNNGSWSSPASCTEVICPDPPQVVNGTYLCKHNGDHKLNDACQLQCDPGFKPSEVGHTIYCQTQDTWSAPSTCQEKRCDGLPEVSHGTVVCNSTVFPVNIECSLKCDPGFTSSSFIDKVFCLNDETWTPVSCIAPT